MSRSRIGRNCRIDVFFGRQPKPQVDPGKELEEDQTDQLLSYQSSSESDGDDSASIDAPG